MKTFSVFDLPIHLSDDYEGWLCDRIYHNIGTHVVTMNSEMAMMAQKNNDLKQYIQNADLVVPDGSGVVLYLRQRGQKQKRVAGIELAESLVKRLGQKGKENPICFYGAAVGVTDKAAKKFQALIPDIYIINNHGFLQGDDLQAWCEKIKQVQPKLILVGLGVPRQEEWIVNHRHLAPNAVWIGVGGSFDIWGGVKERAPKFFCDNNLEWLYRLYQEPWRWKRMMMLPRFFIKSLFYKG
ncbi:N-acetylmannosaminyltransferase [Cyanobacterium stanieri PCC 7202]|uniref:N-acetylmannosaminyltransferase n=1 Tax=Cyanobacterium stanieri (strain ATCC 29140 / PCC 7202) TaxID=292563 RepID=K9YM25_CYASC|nr:N-acetylmannosaminyltransferase [Cyanobacterium stanieri PCC 7202]